MPRSGIIGTYSLPPNTNNQAPNTPISSSMFNAFASDVQQTFNDPTPIAYGGTGAATAAAAATALEVVSYAAQTIAPAQQGQARANINALGPNETADRAFRQGNILGTVSQTAGVPTGAIIERGSNANGEYVRFADGTQICTVSTLPALSGSIAPQTSGSVSVAYPSDFIASPAFSFVGFLSTSTGIAVPYSVLSYPQPGLSSLTLYLTNISTTMTITYIDNPRVIIVGRWF